MNLIHGQHVFRVAGFNMVLGDEGAAAFLQNALGTTFPLVIDEVVSKQLFKAHTAELLPGGDYKLVVKSRAGDAAGPLQTSFRKVKYLRVEDPETFTFTGVSNEDGPMGYINYSLTIHLHGTGLVEGTTIEAKPTDSAGEFFPVPGGYMDFDSDELIKLDSEIMVGDMTLWDYLMQTVGISSAHNSVTFRITQDGESKTATATVNFE